MADDYRLTIGDPFDEPPWMSNNWLSRMHTKITRLYETAKAIAHWVEETFEVSCTESGMTALLHRLGYVHKKLKLVPEKADARALQEFLAEYQKLKQK